MKMHYEYIHGAQFNDASQNPKTVKVEMTVTIKSGAFSDGYPITVCI